MCLGYVCCVFNGRGLGLGGKKSLRCLGEKSPCVASFFPSRETEAEARLDALTGPVQGRGYGVWGGKGKGEGEGVYGLDFFFLLSSFLYFFFFLYRFF